MAAIAIRKCGRCKHYFETPMYGDYFVCPHCGEVTDNRPKNLKVHDILIDDEEEE
jgi:predicted RNA-binding Zn-ribbon protein involved in translation (DUF1610 family)